MILTISGLHGTGKSTIGRLIAEKLGIKYYSTGQAFRDCAKEFNMTLAEFTRYVEEHPEIDKKLDEKIIDIAEKGNIIIDSQLSGYLLKNIADVRILLTCSLEIRIKRIGLRDNISYEESLKETLIREKSELERFKKLYNINLDSKEKIKEIYNVVLATEENSIEEILEKLLDIIKNTNL